MKKSFFGVLLPLVLIISGCGGGGSSSSGSKPASSLALSSAVSSSVTPGSLPVASSISSSSVVIIPPSSSSVVSSSSSLASSSAPAINQLTIQGSVVADALAGGEIIFTIGAKTYKAPIDDSLNYNIALDIPLQDIDKPFTAIATGMGGDQWVQLAALYPSLGNLVALAGNNILDASEYHGVNISPLTTAEYSIIVGNKLALNSDEERKYALLQVDAADKLKRAAYLVRHLTDIDTELSPQHKTTLDLLLDKFYVGGQLNIKHQYGDNLENEILAITVDQSQTYVSKQALVGKFLLRAGSFTYLLTLDAAGTGRLLTSNTPGVGIWASNGQYHEAAFTWVRKGKIIRIDLNEPISYGDTMGFDNHYLTECVDSSSGVGLPSCSVTLRDLQISLIDENEVGKIADVQLGLTVAETNGYSVGNGPSINYFATLLDASQLYKITKDELQGFTWFTNNYSYLFNADGTATQVNSFTKAETQVNWQLDDGRVILDGESLDILPLYPQGPGLVAMQLLQDSESGAYQQTLLIKRESVSMSATDWIGRWNRGFEVYFSSASDFYENHQFRDSFETRLMGSWSVVNSTHISGRSNGAWRMEYELLAINNGQHYMQHCYGMNSDNFIPSGCVIEAYVIDKTFSGATFWESWSNPLLLNSETGEYWQFWGHELYSFNSVFYPHRSFIKVAPNLFLDYYNGKILEMLASDVNSIEVCEYAVSSYCDESEQFTLERTPELKIAISGNGIISYEGRDFTSTGSMMVPKEAKSLPVYPATGHELLTNNITGCGGVLNGNHYDIPAPQADCEISVKFTPVQ